MNLRVGLLGAICVVSLAAPAKALNFIENGSFESPGFAPNTPNQVPDTTIPGWSSSTGSMEIWTNSFQGRTAFEGTQFAEIQDNQLGTSIFQTFTPSFTLSNNPSGFITFQFAHQGRAGTDTVRLTVKQLAGDTTLFTQDYATGNTGWSTYTGKFSVLNPANELEVRFTSIASAICPDQCGQGNFLDAVTFQEEVPGPLPILGAGTAFAFSRRLRRRINQSAS